jgi:type I restriction enzyme S subunit
MSKVLADLAAINPTVSLPSGATGVTPVSFVPMSDVTESGDWIGHQIRKLGDVRNGFTAFADGDVLVAKITPCFENGKGAHVSGLVNGIGYGSTEFHILRAREGASPRYVHHIVQSAGFRHRAEAHMSGSAGQRRVPREFFAVYDVPDLAPAEQAQIAVVLDTLDTTIRQTEAIIAKLKQVKQGLLHDLLTRGIGANGELRPPPSEAPHLYKASPLGWIPREWRLLPADHACEAVIDCKNRTPPEATSGHPVIRTPNVRDGRFVRDGLAYTDSLSFAIWTQRGQPRRGDVLITREAPVGEVCLLPEDMTDACLGQRMMMYRPDPTILESDFMLIALLSAPVQKSLLDLAGGSTVGHVKVGDIRRLRIPIPPRDEQVQIVQAYGVSQARLASEQALSAKLQQQKSGLMDDLLTGRVRVTPLLQGQAT